MISHLCPQCGGALNRKINYINRAAKLGVPIYCSRVCSGLARRVNRTEVEKKEIKRLYDIERRNDIVISMYTQLRMLDYNESPAGRAMQKRNRERFKENHLEYCRSAEYRAWKKAYDQEHVGKKKYGELWESYIILNKLETFLMPERKKIKQENGLLSKSQKRKRIWNSLQQTLKKHYGTP